jgi:hypothetical protein
VDSVTILLELSRRKLLVALALLAAIAVGWIVAFKPSFPPESRRYEVGIATARVLVDTPRSQFVAVAPKGSETLGERAKVLASLMVDGEVKDIIAKHAGLRSNQLIAIGQTGDEGEAAALGRDDFALKTGVVVTSDQAELPILRVEAQAPDPQRAAKLADAAVAGLGEYLDSKAAGEPVSQTRRLRVAGLGPAQAHAAARGPGQLLGLGAAILVFVTGCGAILVLSAMVRGWRTAVDLEEAFSAEDAAFASFFDGEGHENGSDPHDLDAAAAGRR